MADDKTPKEASGLGAAPLSPELAAAEEKAAEQGDFVDVTYHGPADQRCEALIAALGGEDGVLAYGASYKLSPELAAELLRSSAWFHSKDDRAYEALTVEQLEDIGRSRGVEFETGAVKADKIAALAKKKLEV